METQLLASLLDTIGLWQVAIRLIAVLVSRPPLLIFVDFGAKSSTLVKHSYMLKTHIPHWLMISFHFILVKQLILFRSKISVAKLKLRFGWKECIHLFLKSESFCLRHALVSKHYCTKPTSHDVAFDHDAVSNNSGATCFGSWSDAVKYRQISDIKPTKSQNLNVSPLVLQLSLCSISNTCVKSRMMM